MRQGLAFASALPLALIRNLAGAGLPVRAPAFALSDVISACKEGEGEGEAKQDATASCADISTVSRKDEAACLVPLPSSFPLRGLTRVCVVVCVSSAKSVE